MTAVVDASAIVELLLGSSHADEVDRAIGEGAFAPELMDIEVVQTLIGLERRGQMEATIAALSIRVLENMPITRLPHGGLLEDAWDHRKNLTAYDAIYAALANRLGIRLVTADRGLAGTPGLGVPVTLIPTG
jgi:predicted nucleic acid-binding protein